MRNQQRTRTEKSKVKKKKMMWNSAPGFPLLPISVNIFVSSVPSITRAYPSTTLAHPNSSGSIQFWVTLSQSGSPFVTIFSVANRCRIFLNKQSWWHGNKHQKGNTQSCVKDGSCNGFRGVYFTKNEGRFLK